MVLALIVCFALFIAIFAGMSKFSAVDELNENLSSDSSYSDSNVDSGSEDDFDVNYQE